MDYVLFLDDVRHPEYMIYDDLARHFEDRGLAIIWANTVNMARYYIELYGLPKIAYLDHDLGEETAMHLLNWLRDETDLCQKNPPFQYVIHSANPVGRANILSFMESWKNSFSACSSCDGNGCNHCLEENAVYPEDL